MLLSAIDGKNNSAIPPFHPTLLPPHPHFPNRLFHMAHPKPLTPPILYSTLQPPIHLPSGLRRQHLIKNAEEKTSAYDGDLLFYMNFP